MLGQASNALPVVAAIVVFEFVQHVVVLAVEVCSPWYVAAFVVHDRFYLVAVENVPFVVAFVVHGQFYLVGAEAKLAEHLLYLAKHVEVDLDYRVQFFA